MLGIPYRNNTVAIYLDSFCIKLEPFLLVHQEFLNILALIALKLDHLAHLCIVDDGAIASCIRNAGISRRPRAIVEDIRG